MEREGKETENEQEKEENTKRQAIRKFLLFLFSFSLKELKNIEPKFLPPNPKGWTAPPLDLNGFSLIPALTYSVKKE